MKLGDLLAGENGNCLQFRVTMFGFSILPYLEDDYHHAMARKWLIAMVNKSPK